jgi:DNA-directed RNA polymerase subunit RPC12/RpoP
MKLVEIATYDNYLLANITLGLLQTQGVVASLQDEYTVQVDPLLNIAVGGIKLMVAELQVEQAYRIIHEAELAYIANLPCKKCGTKNLVKCDWQYISKNIFEKLKNRFLYGQAMLQTKLYHCTNCSATYHSLSENI